MNRRNLFTAAATLPLVSLAPPVRARTTRVSVRKDDPGHAAWCYHGAWNSKWIIAVDGEAIRYAITADTREGFVLCCALNAKGQKYAIGDQVATRVVRGRVQIFCDGVEL